MNRLPLSLIAHWAGGELHGEDLVIEAITQDTRALVPGSLYVALRGERFDGHDFAVDAIVADILAGFSAPGARVERDRARAILGAIAQAGPDDIVLVAGKGHEPYQEVAGVRHPFDDRQQARQVLEARA